MHSTINTKITHLIHVAFLVIHLHICSVSKAQSFDSPTCVTKEITFTNEVQEALKTEFGCNENYKWKQLSFDTDELGVNIIDINSFITISRLKEQF
ncbi:MAG: hypothetical protein IPP71_15010 [Bacteroidetes bacterium]|nr:hypothetical protein [Bacteroidota bacterium]